MCVYWNICGKPSTHSDSAVGSTGTGIDSTGDCIVCATGCATGCASGCATGCATDFSCAFCQRYLLLFVVFFLSDDDDSMILNSSRPFMN